MIFIAKGSFQNGRSIQGFTKEIDAVSKKLATERVFAEFGSRHKCNRRQIRIDEITEKRGDKGKPKIDEIAEKKDGKGKTKEDKQE